MSNFVGTPPFLRNALWVAMETMHFHIAQTNVFFEDNFVSHLGGPNEQFGTHEKLSRGGGGVQCRLNYTPGYYLWHLWQISKTVFSQALYRDPDKVYTMYHSALPIMI